jgi:hypothetical protein
MFAKLLFIVMFLQTDGLLIGDVNDLRLEWGRGERTAGFERWGRSNHHLRQKKLTMPYSSPA